MFDMQISTVPGFAAAANYRSGRHTPHITAVRRGHRAVRPRQRRGAGPGLGAKINQGKLADAVSGIVCPGRSDSSLWPIGSVHRKRVVHLDVIQVAQPSDRPSP